MNRTVGFIVARGWMSICAFAAFTLIGQFLSPAEFGVFALASSLSLLPLMFVGAGFYEHVMSHAIGDAHDETAYWCSAIMGVLAALATLLIGLAVDPFFERGKVLGIMAPLALQPLFWGFTVTREAELVRAGKGARMATVLFWGETSGFAVLLIMLQLHQGVMSLVASRVINQGVIMFAYAFAYGRLPKLLFDTRAAFDMTRFSIGIMGGRILGWLEGYGGDAIIAGVLRPSGLGIFRMGARLCNAAAAVLVQAPGVAQIAFVGAAHKISPGRAAAVTLRTIRLHLAIAAAFFAGIAATSDRLIAVLLNPEWREASAITVILSAGAIGAILYNACTATLVARGRSRQLFFVSAGSAALSAAAMIVGAFAGPNGVALGKTLAATLYPLAILFLFNGVAKDKRLELLRAILAITMAAAVLILTTLGALHVFGEGGHWLMELIRMGVAGLLGLVAYGLALRAFAPRAFRLVRYVLTAMLRRRRRPQLAPAT